MEPYIDFTIPRPQSRVARGLIRCAVWSVLAFVILGWGYLLWLIGKEIYQWWHY